ncbi:hypothetical protein ACJJTC_007183 [Scirpophaga incertulas]
MEVKFLIVLIACLSCLVPAALSAPVDVPSAVGAVAGAAIKGVAALGAKGALKTAGVLAAKGLAVKGLLAKGLAVKALLAKGLAAKAALAKGAIVAALAAKHKIPHVHENIPSVEVLTPKPQSILGRIAELVRDAHVPALTSAVVHSHEYYRQPVVQVVQPVHRLMQPVVHTVHEYV